MATKAAKSNAHRDFLIRHGFRITWVAQALGITEELLRYHLSAGFQNEAMAEKFKQLMADHAANLLKELPEIPATKH